MGSSKALYNPRPLDEIKVTVTFKVTVTYYTKLERGNESGSY